MIRKRQFVPAIDRRKKTAVFAVVLLIVALFFIPPTHRAIRYIAGGIGKGFVRTGDAVGGWFSNIGTAIRTKHSLQKENDALKAEIAEMEARVSERTLLAKENAELKSAMGRDDMPSFTLAAILSKPPRSAYDTLLVDGGSRAGIAVGQLVYADGHTPIGAVSETTPTTAVVLLFSAPKQTTNFRLMPGGIDVDALGQGGGNFSIEVPHEVTATADTVLVTKDIHPKVVATFVRVVSDARDPFQTLLFASPANFNDLSFVQIRQQ